METFTEEFFIFYVIKCLEVSGLWHLFIHARNLEQRVPGFPRPFPQCFVCVCVCVCVCVRARMLSHVQVFVTPWTVTRQVSL